LGSFACKKIGRHPLLESLESRNDSKKKFLHLLLLIQRWAVQQIIIRHASKESSIE
jgi:hypothetical protein